MSCRMPMIELVFLAQSLRDRSAGIVRTESRLMAKMPAELRPHSLTMALLVAVHVLFVASASSDEPRVARRGVYVPPAQIADRVFKPLDRIQVEPQLRRPVLPEDCAATLFSPPIPVSPETLRREKWKTSVYAWTPPEFFHRPLYFDDQPLERHGQTIGPRLQPAVSTVKFFSDVALLPYRMVVDTPHQWVSPLGYERPGTDAPPVRERMLTLPGEYPRRPVIERPILDGQ